VSASDRERLDDYATNVREIERRLQIAMKAASVAPEDFPVPIGVPQTFDEHIKLQFDLMALAFQADITRVGTLLFARDLTGRTYPQSEAPTSGFHGVSHHGEDPRRIFDLAKINVYHVKMLAHLIDRLAKTKDGDGTLLDQSLVLYGSNMGNSNQHVHYDVPHVLVGGANGKLKGGRHLAYPSKTGADGQPAAQRPRQVRYPPGQHRRQHRTVGGAVKTANFQLPTPKRVAFGVLCALALSALSVMGAGKSDVADAAMRGDKAAVRKLISAKADVNAPQNDGATALHWAVYRGDRELVTELIRAGANPKAANREGATPMWLAAVNGDAAILAALLEGGADANEKLPLGRTPLMIASRTGNVDAMKVLIDHGADVNAKETQRGTTPIMWAADEGHAAALKLLIDRGADIKARSNPAPRGRGPALARPTIRGSRSPRRALRWLRATRSTWGKSGPPLKAGELGRLGQAGELRPVGLVGELGQAGQVRQVGEDAEGAEAEGAARPMLMPPMPSISPTTMRPRPWACSAEGRRRTMADRSRRWSTQRAPTISSP
jgi:ankyrin repeat protein